MIRCRRPGFHFFAPLLKRWVIKSTRNLSVVPTRSERDERLADPPFSLDTPSHSDLLNAMRQPDLGGWPRNETTGAAKLLTEAMPRMMLQEPLREEDVYQKRKRDQQLKLEENFVYESLEQYRKFVKDTRQREKAAALPFARVLVKDWLPPMIESITAEQDRILKSSGQNVASQRLLLLEADELAVLTIHGHTLSMSLTTNICVVIMGVLLRGNVDKKYDGQMTFVEVARRLGNAVQAQVNLLKLKQRIESENKRRTQLNKILTQLASGEVTESVEHVKGLEEWERKLLERAMKMESKIRIIRNRWKGKDIGIKEVSIVGWTLGKEQAKWDEPVMIQVGAALINLFKETAIVRIDKNTGKVMGQQATSVCSNEPVLKHEVIWQRRTKGPRRLGVLTIHPAVIHLAEQHGAHASLSLTKSYPMVCPPMPWKLYNEGAYLSTPSKVIRSLDIEEPAILVRRADTTGQLDRVYQALTVLGSTAWVMNKDVFEVVEQVWQDGGGKLGLPTRTNVPIPSEAPPRYRILNQDGAMHAMFHGETPLEAFYRKLETARARKKNSEMHSLRCDVELKLAVAKKFLDEEELYFPHNMDFRGRAYPIPPHLNHLGNDMSRGLLLFAKAKELGEHGLDWLYIQIANLYGAGENKKALDKRLEFGTASLDKILDSANSPLKGLQWWMNADSPWQLLATCIEIRNALDCENPQQYKSRMHIHQDGSCNGLQHYAALGRDAVGAGTVNLKESSKPNDVYTEISQVVQKLVQEDANNGNKWAAILTGHIDRKLVKQTVMTSVYGVTFIGAREQIANRLKERGWEDDRDLFHVSCYAARVTMDGLHKMFHNAKDVMRWLSECAGTIAAANCTVRWTTPLGLPVCQPYRTGERQSVKTILQDVQLVNRRDAMPVLKRRQRTAFAPNYIHSLDSTHMMMTALGCNKKSITFAGVHDSFWTHAGSVDEMNRILRDKFYELHSQPLLEELKTQFEESYREQVPEFPELPELGNFDLKEIYEANYFFN